MKIGLACCGSGPGAKYAHVLAETLESLSLKLEMVSCSSLSAASLLLWSRGIPSEEIEKRMTCLTENHGEACNVEKFCSQLPQTKRCRLAINSVDCESGAATIWADGISSEAWNWKINPLMSAEALALQCAMGCNIIQTNNQDQKLTDFSCRYGCPFFPLRMAGVERILCTVFTGGEGKVECAGECLSVLTGKNADLCYNIRFSPYDGADEMRAFILSQQPQLYEKLLF